MAPSLRHDPHSVTREMSWLRQHDRRTGDLLALYL